MSADVVVIAVSMLLIGFLYWFFFGPKRARNARVVGGVQEVTITVKGGYSPSLIRVRQGVPLRLSRTRTDLSCSLFFRSARTGVWPKNV